MEIPLLDSWWPLAVLLCGGLVYLYGTWNYDYWKKRGVPFVKPSPFFGNLGEAMLVKKSFGDTYQELYWKLDPHPYGGIFKFRKPAVLVRDPELVKQVMVKDFPSFQKNDIDVDMNVDRIFGRNPFVLQGERWKTTRSHLTPAFTSGKLKPVFQIVEGICEELKTVIPSFKTADGVDVKEMAARYTTDVVGNCAYGIKCNALQNPKSEFREMGKSIIEPDSWNNIKLMLIFYFPQLCNMFKVALLPKKTMDFFERIVSETVSFRKNNKVTRNDFMQLLIDIKDKQASSKVPVKGAFTDIDIAAHAVTFFTDGFETSSLALSFALYELALNPEVQEKLRDEVDDVINKNDGRLTYDGIQEMKYLDMVLSETQRLHPPVYVLMKICTHPFDLKTPSGGTYRVEVGTPVHIPLYSLHLDPKYFPEPERFDPERFSDENKNSFPKYAYLPFGEGPRICLGMRFAQMQVKAAIATIVQNFEIRPTKRTTRNPVLDPNYLFHYIKGGVWLDFVKRKI